VAELAATVLWVALVWCVLLGVGATLAVRSLRRTNRVSPTSGTRAPVTWLVSPSRPARMHRQLRNLGSWVTSHPAASGDTTWNQLLDEVARADGRLVVATRANPRIRTSELDAVSETISRLEDLAVRLRNLEQPATPADHEPSPPDGVSMLERRIEHLEQAHADLEDLERRLADSLGETTSQRPDE
jgi:hypothetical protein